MSAVEDVATAIAEQARRDKWTVTVGDEMPILEIVGTGVYVLLCCEDASQARRLAEMMSGPPPRGVFNAIGIDPVDPLDRFPSVRGKA